MRRHIFITSDTDRSKITINLLKHESTFLRCFPNKGRCYRPLSLKGRPFVTKRRQKIASYSDHFFFNFLEVIVKNGIILEYHIIFRLYNFRILCHWGNSLIFEQKYVETLLSFLLQFDVSSVDSNIRCLLLS